MGTNVVPAVVGFREVDTHRVLDFEQRVVEVAIFRGLQVKAVSVRLVVFAVRNRDGPCQWDNTCY